MTPGDSSDPTTRPEKPTARGIVAGTLLLSGVLKASLFQVTRTDPATYVSVALLLMSIAVLACLIPVRRATSVSPIVALRHD